MTGYLYSGEIDPAFGVKAVGRLAGLGVGSVIVLGSSVLGREL